MYISPDHTLVYFVYLYFYGLSVRTNTSIRMIQQPKIPMISQEILRPLVFGGPRVDINMVVVWYSTSSIFSEDVTR